MEVSSSTPAPSAEVSACLAFVVRVWNSSNAVTTSLRVSAHAQYSRPPRCGHGFPIAAPPHVSALYAPLPEPYQVFVPKIYPQDPCSGTNTSPDTRCCSTPASCTAMAATADTIAESSTPISQDSSRLGIMHSALQVACLVYKVDCLQSADHAGSELAISNLCR